MSVETTTFGQKVIAFNAGLRFTKKLPADVHIMNPFRENACATPASTAFYSKYYNDHKPRRAIMGINPGRFGAGITGVPFTDPKRLAEFCHISLPECPPATEPSSIFVYEVITAWGGVESFYADFYINSFCPLGFVKENAKGRRVNYNYYDDAELTRTVTPFIIKSISKQLEFPLLRDICFCLGTGKNFAFIEKLNAENGFFEKIIPLPHPRFIVQYRSKERGRYVGEYVEELSRYR